MSVRLGIVMDPIARINFKKDSSLAMLLAAQARGWSLFYMEQQDLYQKRRRRAWTHAPAEGLQRCLPLVRTGSGKRPTAARTGRDPDAQGPALR